MRPLSQRNDVFPILVVILHLSLQIRIEILAEVPMPK